MSADPRDPQYLDEVDVRAELTHVFDRCDGCRQCVDLCPTFPLLFERIERRAGGAEREAGRLTPADQDEIVDSCLLCNRCVGVCPPGMDVHVPHTVLRARAMSHDSSHTSLRTARTNALVGRPDRLANFTRAIPLGRRVAAAPPGSVTRRVARALTGVSAIRLLPPYARQRFSSWFRSRPITFDRAHERRVTLWPTCLVEYHEPAIGRDLVAVYERNGIACELSGAGCCGAAALHAGDLDHFRAVAVRNTELLASEVLTGNALVVPQPTCRSVIVEHYPRFVDDPDVERVVACIVGAAEPLVALHDDPTAGFDTGFDGAAPSRITMHLPCHAGSGAESDATRRLLDLIGAEVMVVAQCSGSGGAWGARSGHEALSLPMARGLGAAVTAADGEVIVGECHAANTAIVEQTGESVMHPIQVLARAYGIAPS